MPKGTPGRFVCSVETCSLLMHAHGMCRSHWHRVQRWGDARPDRPFLSSPVDERFWAQVDRRGIDDCWMWTGRLAVGYGSIGTNRRTVLAHRFAYETLVGPIPEGLVLDHLCHTRDAACRLADECPHRACVNPRHLQPVTNEENSSRVHPPLKTHCPQGHEYTEANRYPLPHGRLRCRICKRNQDRINAARIRERKRAGAYDQLAD